MDDIAALEKLKGIFGTFLFVKIKFLISLFIEFHDPDAGYFTGLTNFNNVQCNDDQCLNQLHWASDGGALTMRNNINLHITQAKPCTKYRNGEILSADCAAEKSFICQFSCDESK